MVEKKLINYIIEQRKKGFNYKKISEHLLKFNYSLDLVNSAIQSAVSIENSNQQSKAYIEISLKELIIGVTSLFFLILLLFLLFNISTKTQTPLNTTVQISGSKINFRSINIKKITESENNQTFEVSFSLENVFPRRIKNYYVVYLTTNIKIENYSRSFETSILVNNSLATNINDVFVFSIPKQELYSAKIIRISVFNKEMNQNNFYDYRINNIR